MPDETFDCVIVGGGPAGLSAATYLSRFRRRVLVVDAGQSRAGIIPRTRNVPGFPDGIPGAALLSLLRDQASRYGAQFRSANVTEITRADVGFRIATDLGRCTTSAILFATGVQNIELDFADHDEAVEQGRLRYCPICDGYEVIDKRIAIVGNSVRSDAERDFLRTYSSHIALYAADEHAMGSMRADGVRVEEYACAVRLLADAIVVETATGAHRFDSLYSCLGVRANSALAAQLGVVTDKTGAIKTDAHQCTNIRFAYAAGDIVAALDQIAVGFGHAAIAATAIHNDLRKR